MTAPGDFPRLDEIGSEVDGARLRPRVAEGMVGSRLCVDMDGAGDAREDCGIGKDDSGRLNAGSLVQPGTMRTHQLVSSL